MNTFQMRCVFCLRIIGEYLTDGTGLPNIWWFKCIECMKEDDTNI